MSTKSKRRYARRHSSPPANPRRGDSSLTQDDRRIAGELMSAILAAISFGALAHEQ